MSLPNNKYMKRIIAVAVKAGLDAALVEMGFLPAPKPPRKRTPKKRKSAKTQ